MTGRRTDIAILVALMMLVACSAATTSGPGSTTTPGTSMAQWPSQAAASAPAIGIWHSTDQMGTARAQHTATLLPDGNILVAGGVDSSRDETAKALTSAELYDPRTDTWSATGSMVYPRARHTATLLPNGLVLVAGGYCPGGIEKECPAVGDLSGAFAASEVYDPKTGTWTLTGSMTSPRSEHTATLLADGRVLVAGAELAPDAILASTELYDQATGQWTATGNMLTARWQHFAIGLPDGEALVGGGYGPISPTTNGILNSVEIYDPETGKWRPGEGLLVPRATGGVAVLLSGSSVLIAGGDGGGNEWLASAELYDPAAGSRATGSMSTARGGFAYAPLSDGRVLVVGGLGLGNVLTSAEIYDATLGSWSEAGDMEMARFGLTATRLGDGRVLVTGGFVADGVTSSAELFSPQ